MPPFSPATIAVHLATALAKDPVHPEGAVDLLRAIAAHRPTLPPTQAEALTQVVWDCLEPYAVNDWADNRAAYATRIMSFGQPEPEEVDLLARLVETLGVYSCWGILPMAHLIDELQEAWEVFARGRGHRGALRRSLERVRTEDPWWHEPVTRQFWE